MHPEHIGRQERALRVPLATIEINDHPHRGTTLTNAVTVHVSLRHHTRPRPPEHPIE
ncbi:hypothetical protein ACFQ0M_46230 [Kitasatospora aburaviensis]